VSGHLGHIRVRSQNFFRSAFLFGTMGTRRSGRNRYQGGHSSTPLDLWPVVGFPFGPSSFWFSFPSGHTSAAFQGASFIQLRYGWRAGLPAYAGATFVAFSRVYADKHFVSDVVAGAALGTLSSFLFTDRFDGVEVIPSAGGGRLGLEAHILPWTGESRPNRGEPASADRPHRRPQRGLQLRCSRSLPSPCIPVGQLGSDQLRLEEQGRRKVVPSRLEGLLE